MQLVIPRETQPGENRVSATPETVKKLVRLGAEVVIESGAGTGAGISDADYEAAGASIGSEQIFRHAKKTEDDVQVDRPAV